MHKRSKVVIFISIIAVIFGIFGFAKSIPVVGTPLLDRYNEQKIIDYQNFLNSKLVRDTLESNEWEQYLAQSNRMLDIIKNTPRWYYPAIVVLGILGLAVNCFYVYSAVILFLLKKHAIHRLSLAILFAIALGVAITTVSIIAHPNQSGSILLGGLVGPFLNSIFFVIVFANRKKYLVQNLNIG